MRLIADIGGTNARLALSEAGQIVAGSTRSYTNAKWGSLYEVVDDFLSLPQMPALTEVVIALAGPVQGTRAELTNYDWQIGAEALSDLTGAGKVHLLNDLTALGYAVPQLRTDQLTLLREGQPKGGPVQQSLVVGIGTGFNVSPVLQHMNAVICPAVEAGHISMPHSVSTRLPRLGCDPQSFGTIETLFSGRGFAAFCQQLTGQPDMTGPEAIGAYSDPAQPKVTKAVDAYAALLGHLLQDLSLAYMPLGGLYLAGSVARSVLSTARQPCFDTFGAPRSILVHKDTPVWAIADDLAALTGCAKIVL